MSKPVTVTLEFSGGLETVFNNIKSRKVTIPAPEDGKTLDMGYVVKYLADNLLKGNRDMFVLADKIRPGILVLINDADWELEGEEEYEPKDGDSLLFVSTLHGG
ncbi:ubiquitin-related modifier 1 [Ascobolus immersus RN42]|uniref:Ubiquitin-related modifier 1 n=1 Tax=Ascobolus immersus RN42 TaxID=1160509 RepID=A0A3N4II20_ASCIM|nr:ubiquitin-related modifier 1 [Ascobolus immersus RN42]